MPPPSTVIKWVHADWDGFGKQYAEAREAQAHALADDLLEIADDGRNDWMAKNDGENAAYELNGEHVQRSRLRLDTRKWLASKILPKVYGEKITQEVTTENVHRLIGDAPIDKDEWATKYANGAKPVVIESDDAT
jgi:tyrosyl-tRNA synthetase